MPHHRPGRGASCRAALALILAAAPARAEAIRLKVQAGPHTRHAAIARAAIPADRLDPATRDALVAGPRAVRVEPADAAGQGASIGQLDRPPGPDSSAPARLTWVVPGDLAAGSEAAYRFDPAASVEAAGPWTIDRSDPAWIEVRAGDRPVLRYNAAPVSNPAYKPIYTRDAYLHPVHAPSGAVVTGDFSAWHTHHRGIFLAYAAATVGSTKADFWNIHTDHGRIQFEALDRAEAGPVSARVEARHRWLLRDGPGRPEAVVLRERWEVELLPSPDPRAWLFELTSTQQAAERPVVLTPYRYGGMAYRGPDPFVKGKLDVLTSAGLHRVDGDQKAARWVDLTGPVSDGSAIYAGAMVADHPGNPHAPTVARIHPTTLPFFSYVPAHDVALTIAADRPSVFRYRVLVHDGRPDPGLDDRVWRDFAEPVGVAVEPARN